MTITIPIPIPIPITITKKNNNNSDDGLLAFHWMALLMLNSANNKLITIFKNVPFECMSICGHLNLSFTI